VDVELHRASLADALQLLADEARLNLVLGDGIGGEVSLSLRRVDPLEALRAVVASRGLSLSQQGSITVVQRR
jgi:type II secretory pathway component HofQ